MRLVRRRRTRVLGPLDRLRLRLTAWYVATLAAILLVLGGGIFLAVAQQIGAELDHQLDARVDLLIATRRAAPERATASQAASDNELSAYLFDDRARPISPDTASAVMRDAARRALLAGSASLQVPLVREQEVRVRARAFRTTDGRREVAVAGADLEDLEDRYARLITLFAAAAASAVALVAGGGVLLARKSAEPIERTVEGMRRFMSDAGHEMRTPVTVLRTEADVALRRPRDAEEDAASFTRIARESARLSTVVDDLFTLARAESGELPVQRDAVFLDDIVSDAVMAVGLRAREAGVSLELADFDEGSVRGSATLLSRAAMILLDNAVKYTPAGGTVVVRVRAAAEDVVLEVSDTGPGIAPDALPLVFDRFYRTESARASSPGAGLGLSIARWIAEAHDGLLVLESREGQGTTARLTIPRGREQR